MLFNFSKILKKPKKIKVAVLMGGPSSEHDVSLWTGQMVFKNLDKDKYATQEIIIGKSGQWPLPIKKIKDEFDLAFVAMHGEYGEDGRLQKQLEKHKIPHTGSNSAASALAIDKDKSLKIFAKKKILIAPYLLIKKPLMQFKLEKIKELGLPIVIKPADLGSSVGVSIVKNVGKITPAIKKALVHSQKIMIQKYISGREITCGVLEKNGELLTLPPTEIIPKKGFFDFKAKYTPKASLEITPPQNMADDIIKKIQNLALKAHRALKCSGYSRSDFIADKNGDIFILETNTLPGLTKTSLFPQAAKKAGIAFPDLLDIIINNARKRKK